MSPTTIKMFTGNDGWKKINKVWCSNEHFWDTRDRNWNNNGSNQGKSTRVYNYGSGRMCKYGKCQNQPEIAKDYCSAHPNGVDKTSVASTDDKEDHTRVVVASPLAVVTGGATRREVAGFLQAGILTLSKVEHMVANKTCSKNKAKDFRRAWEDAQQPGRQGERAQKAVARLSEKIIAAIPQRSSIH